ncbi:MAG TPA: T9SS type A sorting domain-containing protein, partial [Bacteroidia bacterium]|nr:T9SS type A sorting domain-containing protein [Bacteroidia bacterium]
GTVWAWGRNNFGQLGDGTNTDNNLPVQVSNLTGVLALPKGSSDASHMLVLRSDSTIWSWGYNAGGQLGNGTNTSSNVPVQVVGLYKIISLSMGGSHSIAMGPYGNLYLWGGNYTGTLGNGNTNDSNLPLALSVPCYMTLGAEEEVETDNLNIMPNPSSGIFKFETNWTTGMISIFNSMGEQVLEKELDATNNVIDLSDQADGIYFVNVNSGKENFSRKIILHK